MVADMEELEKMDAFEVRVRSAQCKGSDDAHEW